VTALCFLAPVGGRELLLCGCEDGTTRIWSYAAASIYRTAKKQRQEVTAAAALARWGLWAWATPCRLPAPSLRVLHAPARPPPRPALLPHPLARSATPAAALADSQGRLMLWEYGAEAKPRLLACKAPGKAVCLAALGGGSGMLLAAGCATGVVLLADAAAGSILACLAAHEGMVQAMQPLAPAALLQRPGQQQEGGGQGDGPAAAEQGDEAAEQQRSEGQGAPEGRVGEEAPPAAAGQPPGQPRAGDAWLLTAGEDGRVCLWDLQQLLAGSAPEPERTAAPAPVRPPPAAYVRLPRGSSGGEGSRARQWVAAAVVHRQGDTLLLAVGATGGQLLLYEMFPGGRPERQCGAAVR
jgi:hypothetical protein